MEREAKRRKKNELKACCSDGDGGGGGVVVVEERRCWEDMNREILSLIFVRIPSDEIARAVAFVCRSWRDAVAEPYCWSHIDVEEWCRRCNEPGVIDYAVRKIVRRSGGILRCLSAYKLSDFSFSFIAQSYCMKITWEGLEAFGKNCKSLIKLRRNIPPPDFNSVLASIAREADEYEAITVADTMPGLIHLELGYGLFSDNGLDAILAKCRALCHLDIRGCWNVRMKGDLEDRCSRIKEFRSPWDDELDNATSSDSDFHGGNEA
ncbi:hypothetical protein MRB53_015124 [Persea americana]|uniref:Uncharacterized protein n=1 Tax=Persea americana TaxID=3435 RepID=A0ACC2KCY4_PERAE|nr:hypothetical protein MRB53_015124 [Persea americana]